MEILVVGTSYKTAPLTLRERLAFPPWALGPALDELAAVVPEGVILSTCHRVELYAAAPDPQLAMAALERFWCQQRGLPLSLLEPHLYRLTASAAAQHLFSVACGLDSAVIGEAQILGQVRDALLAALQHHAAGLTLSALFRHAQAAGKRARAQTTIGRRAASTSSAAVELALHLFGDLRSSRVLLVGAGKMGHLVARNLLQKSVAGIAVVGRTSDRARQLALDCGGDVALARLEEGLRSCDIVITCTTAPHYVLHTQTLARVMAERPARRLLLIDLAVPRDVEPAAADLPGVRLFNIDDLQHIVDANLSSRQAEAANLAPLLAQELARFQRWLATQSVVPTIAALRRHAEDIRRRELARTQAVLAPLSDDDRRRIEALTLAIQKKLLHDPIALLRAAALGGQGDLTARFVRRLFALDDTDHGYRAGPADGEIAGPRLPSGHGRRGAVGQAPAHVPMDTHVP